MRVLICGGRDYQDEEMVSRVLEGVLQKFGEFCLVHGGARGADCLAGQYAERRGLPVIEMRANWNIHGKRAGSLRNSWMLKYAQPDMVVAFPGGTGTAHMKRIARFASVYVWEPI